MDLSKNYYGEKEFPQTAPLRTSTNRRYYSQQNIEALEIVKFLLKTKGLKVQAAKEEIRRNSANITRRIEMIKALESVREDLSELLKSLDKRR